MRLPPSPMTRPMSAGRKTIEQNRTQKLIALRAEGDADADFRSCAA